MSRKIVEKEKVKHKDRGDGIVKEKDIFARLQPQMQKVRLWKSRSD